MAQTEKAKGSPTVDQAERTRIKAAAKVTGGFVSPKVTRGLYDEQLLLSSQGRHGPTGLNPPGTQDAQLLSGPRLRTEPFIQLLPRPRLGKQPVPPELSSVPCRLLRILQQDPTPYGRCVPPPSWPPFLWSVLSCCSKPRHLALRSCV